MHSIVTWLIWKTTLALFGDDRVWPLQQCNGLYGCGRKKQRDAIWFDTLVQLSILTVTLSILDGSFCVYAALLLAILKVVGACDKTV
jgi:hypothetical protein